MNQDRFTPISELGEFGLIDRIEQVIGTPDDEQIQKALGDDAAVYTVGNESVHIITTDVLVEWVHFDRMFTPMTNLGFKAVSVNVSDIAAMNAMPRYATVALGMTNKISVEMIEDLYRGMAHAASNYGLTLVGGDVTAARELFVSITVVGEAKPEQVVYRKGARPGDLICVTGYLGGAYAGLKVLLDEKKSFQEQGEGFQPDLAPYTDVIQRQLAPVARLDVIQTWQQAGIRPRALIDVSDGLASEVNHLCRHSGCGALVYAAALPVAMQTRSVADRFEEDVDTYALFGGEDYELLFALPPGQLDALEKTGLDFTVVGEFKPAQDGIKIRLAEGEDMELEARGFRHF